MSTRTMFTAAALAAVTASSLVACAPAHHANQAPLPAHDILAPTGSVEPDACVVHGSLLMTAMPRSVGGGTIEKTVYDYAYGGAVRHVVHRSGISSRAVKFNKVTDVQQQADIMRAYRRLPASANCQAPGFAARLGA